MGRAQTTVEFVRGFALGASQKPLLPDAKPDFADGWATGRMLCHQALSEYLRERGFGDWKEYPVAQVLHDAEVKASEGVSP